MQKSGGQVFATGRVIASANLRLVSRSRAIANVHSANVRTTFQRGAVHDSKNTFPLSIPVRLNKVFLNRCTSATDMHATRQQSVVFMDAGNLRLRPL